MNVDRYNPSIYPHHFLPLFPNVNFILFLKIFLYHSYLAKMVTLSYVLTFKKMFECYRNILYVVNISLLNKDSSALKKHLNFLISYSPFIFIKLPKNTH